MSYTMALIVDGREISIPVLPGKLEVTSPGKNEKTTVLEMGEILILRTKGLRSIAWESHFPASSAPYVTGSITEPIEAIRAIQSARDAGKAIRFLITGTDLDVNMPVGIDAFDYEERGGELGDIYYQIRLTEWKDYSPRRLILPSVADKPALAKEPERAGTPTAAKTHTVIKGDCLWAIAQKHYGSGARYPEIYSANRAIIDGRNKGTGNPKYTIYPGQVLTIP